MTPQQRLAMIKAAAEKRKAAQNVKTPTGLPKEDRFLLNKQVDAALKELKTYIRYYPRNPIPDIANIFTKKSKELPDPSYAQTKQLALNNLDQLKREMSRISDPTHKAEIENLRSELINFANRLTDMPIKSTNVFANKQEPSSEIDSRIKNLEKELETTDKLYQKALHDYMTTKKALSSERGISVKHKDEMEQKSKLVDIYKNKKDDIEEKIAELQAEKSADETPEDNTVEPVASTPKSDAEQAAEWLKAHGMDFEPERYKESLNESSSVLLKTMAIKTGLPQSQLEQFWELAVKKNASSKVKGDSIFWGGVMKEFQNLIDKVDIEETKNIMETRTQYNNFAQEFLNSIAEDNYVQAESAFKNMVSLRLDSNIAEKAEKYCQEVLSKEAKKLANDY
jgi:uncharacterized protein YdiU (UPF0061 family)